MIEFSSKRLDKDQYIKEFLTNLVEVYHGGISERHQLIDAWREVKVTGKRDIRVLLKDTQSELPISHVISDAQLFHYLKGPKNDWGDTLVDYVKHPGDFDVSINYTKRSGSSNRYVLVSDELLMN